MLSNVRRPIGTIAYMGGIPAILEEFVWSWSQMVEYNSSYLCGPSESIHYTRAKVSDHAFARNVLAAGMQGDWLLMLDADHQFDPDLAARLLHEFERSNLDILCGVYQFKRDPFPPVLFTRKDKDSGLSHLGKWDVPELDGAGRYLVPVASAGGGCLLVRRSVFNRIKVDLKESPFSHRKGMSEDHSFFDRCNELGIAAYCCPMIESHHLVVRPLSMSEYVPDPNLIGPRIEVA